MSIFLCNNINNEERYRMCIIKYPAPFHLLYEIRQWLHTHFGKAPEKPILDIPEKYLLEEDDVIIVAKDRMTNEIVGTIRYHKMGYNMNNTKDNTKDIYVVDCFCVHSERRGQGIGDILLRFLRMYANVNKKPHALFLKEGAPLSLLYFPMYSGMYVYRRIQNTEISTVVNTVYSITHGAINKWITIYKSFNADCFIIWKEQPMARMHWRVYRKYPHFIVACFQDTYQKKKMGDEVLSMGWCTAWLESAMITDIMREEAAIMLTNSVSKHFDYIWMNRKWIGSLTADWQLDGGFHWYTYQWGSMMKGTSYCIIH
jgi:hypothetical protein